MDHKYEEAITILMEQEGYYWCEKCEEWIEIEDESWYIEHIEEYHNK